MIRASALVLAVALSGCLTECGAIGHGAIGHGAATDGAIVGGVIGGRPAADSGCVPPGSPQVWLAARLESYADNDTITTVTNNGSLGGTATATGGGATFSANEVGGLPAFAFDGASRIDASIAAQSFPVIAVAVARVDGAGVNQILYSATDAFPDLYYLKTSGFARVAHAGTNAQFDGAFPSSSSHAFSLYAEGKTAGDDLAVFKDDTTAATTMASTVSTDLNGYSIGAEYGGVLPMTGIVAEFVAYYGSAASDLIASEGSYTSAIDSVVTCLETYYGALPN